MLIDPAMRVLVEAHLVIGQQRPSLLLVVVLHCHPIRHN